MRLRFLFLTSALVSTSNLAMADVSAQNVWDDWKSYMAGIGYQISGDEVMNGNTLSVNDINATLTMNGQDASYGFGSVEFVENGDGTVSVVFPDEIKATVNTPIPDGPDLAMDVIYSLGALNITASGDADQTRYNVDADRIGMTMKAPSIDGEQPIKMDISFVVEGLSGTSDRTEGDLIKIVQDMKIDKGSYSLQLNGTSEDPEMDMDMSFAYGGLKYQSEMNIPQNLPSGDLFAMFDAGTVIDFAMQFSNSDVDMKIKSPEGDMNIMAVSGNGTADLALSDAGIKYGALSTDGKINVQVAEFPFPVDAGYGRMGVKMQMPFTPSDQMRDIGLGVTLGEVTVSDMIWGLLDPSGQLPRDPVTVSFDLTGKAKSFMDFTNPEAMAKMEENGEMPGELHALNVNDITVNFAGAAVNGTGAFTFNNDDLMTFDGMPAPDGSLSLQASGINGLMDKLTAMGLLPAEQAMGARMMLGMFTVSGDAPDTMTSKIDVHPDGQVLANGQRLR